MCCHNVAAVEAYLCCCAVVLTPLHRCPDDADNVTWPFCERDTSLLWMCPAGVQMLMLKCIVICTGYCFQTFSHDCSHRLIISCKTSCTNGYLHAWIWSKLSAYTHTLSVWTNAMFHANRLDIIVIIACSHICTQVHLSETCTIALTHACTNTWLLTRMDGRKLNRTHLHFHGRTSFWHAQTFARITVSST
jgi:hypothetical protein